MQQRVVEGVSDLEAISARTAHRQALTQGLYCVGEPGHETMGFDYRLYDGPATPRNALRLLAAAALIRRAKAKSPSWLLGLSTRHGAIHRDR